MVKKQFYIGFMLALSVLRIYGRENTANSVIEDNNDCIR